MSNPGIDFVSKRKIAYVCSGFILTIGIVSIVTTGFELGVDLKTPIWSSYTLRDYDNKNNLFSRLIDSYGDYIDAIITIYSSVQNTYPFITMMNSTYEVDEYNDIDGK